MLKLKIMVVSFAIFSCVVSFVDEIKAYEDLEKDTTIQGITFPKGTSVDFLKSGKLRIVNLSQDQEVQGIFCSKGQPIEFYESGKIRSAGLAKDQEIEGISYTRGPIVFFESGKLEMATSAKYQEVQGIPCSKGQPIAFHESGKIKMTVLYIDKEIQGCLCAKGLIYLDESGKVIARILAKDEEIQGIKFLKGSWIGLDKSGRLEQATLIQDQEINGIPCSRGLIQFYKSGWPKMVILAQDKEMQSIKFNKGARICFNESGKLENVNLDQNVEVQGVPYAVSGKVSFNESGRLKSGALAQAQEIQGINFPAGTRVGLNKPSSDELISSGPSVYFDESGKINCAILGSDQEIQGIPFANKTCIYFYKSGKIKSVYYMPKKQEILGIFCDTPVDFYESGKLKRVGLAKDQEIGAISCTQGWLEFYESGALKSAKLAKEQDIQGIKFRRGEAVVFDKSGKIMVAEQLREYLKKYRYVSIKYASPEFIEGNEIVFLTIIDCRDGYVNDPRDSDYSPPLEEVRVVRMSLNDLREKTIFKLDLSDKTLNKMFSDYFGFSIDANGRYCIFEPELYFDSPETMKILIVDLNAHKSSFITRRGRGYKISPDGESLIYMDMGGKSEDYSRKKTLYLSNLGGSAKEPVYETQDSIGDFCWIDNDDIAVSCQTKKREYSYSTYLKFINVRDKKEVNYIKSVFNECPILVSPDKDAIINSNWLFVRKDSKNPVFKDYKYEGFLKSNEMASEPPAEWTYYNIIARGIGTYSWSIGDGFTVGIDYKGDLILTDMKTFDNSVLKKCYDETRH